MFIILRYRFLSFINRLRSLDKWGRIKNLIFLFTGIFLLTMLYISFYKILIYLKNIELIGDLLIWKLSSMVFVISFSMIIISSLIISMTTLFYSYDLKFLFSLPIKEEYIFLDKVIATSFYSSWSLIVILVPYIFALIKVNKQSIDFLLIFLILVIPYSILASSVGIIFSLFLMRCFPGSRTRDVIWILSSVSFSLIYVGLRFSKPEKLLRPDMLSVISEYLSYLQAPTAPYLPSWWFTKALISYSNTFFLNFIYNLILIYAACLFIVIILFYISKKNYLIAYSGSQSQKDKIYFYNTPMEFKIGRVFKNMKLFFLLCFKERLMIKRDVKYYSQIILIVALSMVYIFSIKSLPLDNYEAKNFVSFLNLITVGFVVSAISLRFVFTSISVENGSFWVIKTIPLNIKDYLFSKLLFYYIQILFFSMILVIFSNYYLGVDIFMFRLSVFVTIIMSFVITVFAIGFGSMFPDFNIENIHQVESSYGGFIFMASSFFYCVTIGIVFSHTVRNYFFCQYNFNCEFDVEVFYLSVLMFLIISFLPSYFVFNKAVKKLNLSEV